jgi:hypothetical protein
VTLGIIAFPTFSNRLAIKVRRTTPLMYVDTQF